MWCLALATAWLVWPLAATQGSCELCDSNETWSRLDFWPTEWGNQLVCKCTCFLLCKLFFVQQSLELFPKQFTVGVLS